MKERISGFAAICAALFCVSGMEPWRMAGAQEISQLEQQASILGAGADSPSYYTSRLLDKFELVADGEFYAFPESTAEELRALKEEDVTVKFRVNKLYKGGAQDSVYMQMRIAMLNYPGENISRHARKKEIIAKQDEDLKLERQRYRDLYASYKAGEMEESDFWAELSKVVGRIEERKAEDGLIGPATEYVVIDGTTFFSLGGVIREGEKYLVGVNPIEPGASTYLLTEFESSAIYWGEMREHILPGFENGGEPR